MATRGIDTIFTMSFTVDSWGGGIVAGIGYSVAIGSKKQKLGWLAPGYIFATHNLAFGGYWIIGTLAVEARYPGRGGHGFALGFGIPSIAIGVWDLVVTLMNHVGRKTPPIALAPWSLKGGGGLVVMGAF